MALSALLISLRDGLFKAEAERRARRWVLAPLVVFVAGTGIALGREGAGLQRVWAEDGAIFYPAQRAHGYWSLLFQGYDGYIHLVPRTLTLIAAQFPIRHLAVAFSVESAVVIGLVTTLISRALAAYGAGRFGGMVLGLLLPLAPLALSEVLDVACNIQWFLECGCFWALIWAPREKRWIAASSVLVFLTMGSSPLSLVLVPVALLRVGLLRGRQRVVPVAYLIAAALQGHAMTTSVRGGIVHPDNALDLAKTTGVRLYSTGWFGLASTNGIFAHLHYGILIAVALLWLAVVGACIRARSGGWVVAAAFAAGSAMFLAGTVNNFVTITVANPDGLNVLADDRYAVSPGALFAMAILATLLAIRTRTRFAIPVLVVATVVLTVSMVRDFSYRTQRDAVPTWSAALKTAQHACSSDPQQVVSVNIAPAGFTAPLPCGVLLGR